MDKEYILGQFESMRGRMVTWLTSRAATVQYRSRVQTRTIPNLNQKAST